MAACLLLSFTGPKNALLSDMNSLTHHPISVGRYLVSPLTRRTDGGRFTASLSVRSGRGSASHDRVFRFTPTFATREDAMSYALAQGTGCLPC